MSDARETLKELLVYGVHSEREAEEAINAFAHELAEQIREKATGRWGDFNADEYGTHQNVLDAADFIDPEVDT